MSNVNSIKICQNLLVYKVKKHLMHQICQRKFGRVKGALIVMEQKTIDVNYSKYLLKGIIDGNEVFPISKKLNGLAKIFPVYNDAIYKITS